MAVSLTVAPDFKALCPPLTAEELRLMEESIAEEGCREPIVVWKCGKQTIIIDGHHRYAICTQKRIPYKLRYLDIESRQGAIGWAARNQLGRRNATEEQKSYLRGKLYREAKQPVGSPPKEAQLGQHVRITRPLGGDQKTAKQIGVETGVDERTVRRDEKYSEAVDALGEKSHALRDAALRGDLPKSAAQQLATVPKRTLDRLEKLEGAELRKAAREATKPAEKKPRSTSGKPIIDSRKFKTFEQEIGKCIRLNTDLRNHCNGKGAAQSESIRKHLSNSLEELVGWRRAANMT